MDNNVIGKDIKIEMVSGNEFELSDQFSQTNRKASLSVLSEEKVVDNAKHEDANDQILVKRNRSKSLDHIKFDGFDKIQKRISSIMSLSEYGGAGYLKDDSKTGAWYATRKLFFYQKIYMINNFN